MIQFTFLLSLFFILNCGKNIQSDIKSNNTWMFEGWACSPEGKANKTNPASYCENNIKNEYYYFKHEAKLKIDTQIHPSYLVNLCESEIKEKLKSNRFINSIFIESFSYTDHYFSSNNNPVKNFNSSGLLGCILDDNLTTSNKDSNQCICYSYVKYPGGQKRFEKVFWKLNDQFIDCECHP